MTRTIWKRLVRHVHRRLRLNWVSLRVAVRGNTVQRHLDFSVPIPHPILLLQGFGSTRQALMVLEKRLRADGHDVLSIRLGGLFGTLNTRRMGHLAHDVEEKIFSLRARYPLGKFTIIAHSKGGLVARYLVACLRGVEYIETIITMGTPHQGYPYRQLARVTRWGLVMPSVWQMRPQSQFFRSLRQRTVPATIRCVSICSSEDRIVPSDLCRWEGSATDAIQTIQLSGVSHTDYLIKQRAYDALRPFLPIGRVSSPC